MTLESIASSIVKDISATVNLTIPERERVKKLIVERVTPLLWQPVLNFSDADQKANDEQCVRILELLKSRGEAGATNVELSEAALKYTSRVSDLRAKGHVIQCQRLAGRTFNYKLGREEFHR